MKEIKKIVFKFNSLCSLNKYKEAGILARSNKQNFINMIIKGENKELLYAYNVCSIFNMRQTDCFNLKY